MTPPYTHTHTLTHTPPRTVPTHPGDGWGSGSFPSSREAAPSRAAVPSDRAKAPESRSQDCSKELREGKKNNLETGISV